MRRITIIAIVVVLFLSGAGYTVYEWVIDTAEERIDIDLEDLPKVRIDPEAVSDELRGDRAG